MRRDPFRLFRAPWPSRADDPQTAIVDAPAQPETAPLRRSLFDPDIVLGDGTPTPQPPAEHRLDVLTGRPHRPLACTGCTGLQQTVQALQNERRDLRAQLARHELAAIREQRLKPSQQLP